MSSVLRDLFKTVRDTLVLSLLVYIIVTPEVYGRWKANAELAFYKQAEILNMWVE